MWKDFSSNRRSWCVGTNRTLGNWKFSLFCVGVMATVATMAAQSPELAPLDQGNTAFALQLYGKLRSADGNLVLSPYGISSALTMAYAGARGETARQMEHMLHFTQCKTNLHQLFSRLDAVLNAAQAVGGIELNTFLEIFNAARKILQRFRLSHRRAVYAPQQ